MRIRTLCAWVGVLVLAGVSGTIRAAEAPARQDEGAYIAKPAPEHKLLEQEAGTWDASIKSYMAGPDAEPTVSTGTETNTMIGGLWLNSHFEGDFGGSKFIGVGLQGYDPVKGKYVGTWVDSMSSALMVTEGTYDKASKTLTMYSEMTDPMTNKPLKAKMVSEFKGDTRVFTMSMDNPAAPGEMVKVMEITYKRRAK